MPTLPAPPEDILNAIAEKYKTYKPTNYEIRNELLADKIQADDRNITTRVSTPFVTQQYIKGLKSFKQKPYKIHEYIHNNTRNVEIFDVTYEFNENRTRKVEKLKINNKNKNLVLVGCSLTFGVGVNQGEDLASFLYQKMPQYNVYNMGIPGGGMNDFLTDVIKLKRLNNINKVGGAVIYTMIYPHITRAFCSLECHEEPTKWMRLLINDTYDFKDSGELVSTGSYFESNRTLFYYRELLAKSNFLKFIGYERPKLYSDAYIDKYIEFIIFLKKHYQKMNLDFYLYLPKVNNMFPNDFLDRLENRGIKVLAFDNKNFKKYFNQQKLLIPGDGHMNKMGNDYHASVIADFLKKHGY